MVEVPPEAVETVLTEGNTEVVSAGGDVMPTERRPAEMPLLALSFLFFFILQAPGCAFHYL